MCVCVFTVAIELDLLRSYTSHNVMLIEEWEKVTSVIINNISTENRVTSAPPWNWWCISQTSTLLVMFHQHVLNVIHGSGWVAPPWHLIYSLCTCLSVVTETERKRWKQTSPLSGLWQILQKKGKFKGTSENSHRRETIQLWSMWENFHSVTYPQNTRIGSQWRETIPVWLVWGCIHYSR